MELKQARTEAYSCPLSALPIFTWEQGQHSGQGPTRLRGGHCLHKALPVTSQITGEEESKHSMVVAVSAQGSQGSGKEAPSAWPPIPAAGWQGEGAPEQL